MMRALVDAVRMERVRVLTLRSTYVLSGFAVLLGALLTLLISAGARPDGLDPQLSGVVLTGGAEFVPLPFTAVMMAVLAVLGVGHDYRHGLVRPILTAQPRRWVLVVARLLVLTVVALTVALAGALVNGLIAAAVIGELPPTDRGTGQAVTGYLLLVAMWVWLAAAATWLLRSTVAVLTVLLVTPLVVEPVLSLMSAVDALSWLRPVVRWLPFAAGRVMASSVQFDGDGAELTRWQGGLAFSVLVAAVLVPAWLRFTRRDA
jgi:ABC-2 type transport system permease protein